MPLRSDTALPCPPADWSLVARTGEGVHDQAGPTPQVCSRLAHKIIRHRQEQHGTATRGEEAKAQVERPVRNQMETLEPRSNDS